DLIETERRVHAADDTERVFPPGLVPGKKIAHATGRSYRRGHTSILARPTLPPGSARRSPAFLLADAILQVAEGGAERSFRVEALGAGGGGDVEEHLTEFVL